MQIHLVIPGLIWPGISAISPASGLELPALARMLGLGRHRMAPFEPLDHQLARLFGYVTPASESDSLPLAALRRLGEPSMPAPDVNSQWLCADPVNLSFAREHLLLNEFPADGLDPAEVAALIASLNETFPDLGRFEACTPTRWYLHLAAATHAKLFPLHDVIGRPIKDFLPEGNDARLWQRTLNEAQVLLHNHPVNQAREASGRRPANSLWFWGAGMLRPGTACSLSTVQSREPLTRGLARAAGVTVNEPDCREALKQDTLIVLDSLLKPSLQLDIDSWRACLVELERDWFAPISDSLRTKRLHTLTLTAPGDRGTLELLARATDGWKFWRKPLAFDALLKSLSPSPIQLPGQSPGTTSEYPAR
ncbi:hypothetical protein [Aromatoleum diolicum]|uniref:Regulatory protein n=1 Tax=Aromatoleum diolicum TaxID=75796 RepID=A0ABX1QFM3_9RHOO|nr:hypothetical protein [Aromatoleum diolicum]NMG77227.1 hypothetical protein [Aromatoleum diolicum]